MMACFPRKLLVSVWLGLLNLLQPACQSQAEPYASAQTLNPCITEKESPSRPLSAELVVTQTPPSPAQPATISLPPVVSELPQPSLATSQPPTHLKPLNLQPVDYTPKRRGLSTALDSFLEHRNDEAIAALKHLPANDQDAALVMLPILARLDQHESWDTLSGPEKLACLESLRSLVKRLGKSAPLVLQHVTLVDAPPDRYGEAKPRAQSSYYPEDCIYAYAELVNLLDHINPEGLYNVRLEVTLELRDANDKVYWNGSSTLKKTGSISPRNDYHVTATLNLPRQIAAGSYQLVIIVRDRDTNRTARQSLPLQVLEQKSRLHSSPPRRG